MVLEAQVLPDKRMNWRFDIVLCLQLKKRTIERRSSKDAVVDRVKNPVSNGVDHGGKSTSGKGDKVSERKMKCTHTGDVRSGWY